MPASERLMAEIATLYPWMNQQMLDAYRTSWGEFESSELALSAVRQTDSYQTVFAGNIDENGMARMSESEYFATKAEFDATLESVGINPAYFQDEWVMALENEVSPNEMLGRMEAAYERVIQAAPEIRTFYSETYGIDMTDEAILASAISPRIGEQILNRQIAIAEIGGAAAQRGYDIEGAFAEVLAQEGMTRQGAGQFFGEARSLLPAMEVLARRHDDPNDPFDLEDMAAGFLRDDPEVRREIRRRTAAEGSMFTGGAGIDVARGNTGGLTGLRRS